MNEVVKVTGLSKQFSGLKAVNDLSFTVNRGEVYGFLGQNGAGKSTTIRMLLTLISPTSGSIRIFGNDLHKARKQVLARMGAIIETPDLYPYLTALENMSIMARLVGWRATQKELMLQLEQLGIADRAHSRVKTFSQGMKQRLGLACALVHRPELLVLDEPTNGLDPQGIADVRHLILRLSREEGRTIVVSSHLLGEMEMMADSMLIIDRGRKVAEGKVSGLLNPADTLVRLSVVHPDAARTLLEGSQWNKWLLAEKGLELKMHRDRIPELVRYLVQEGVDIVSIDSRHSLEDYFLSLTTPNQHVAAYQD